MKSIPLSRSLAVVFFLSLSFSSPAADYSKGLLQRDAVVKSAKEVFPEKYPNADDVLVDNHIIVIYQADGTDETWDDTYIKVMTEKGKQENETLSLYYSLPYNEAEVKIVEIIKPDGTIVPIDIATQSKVMIDSSQQEENIYDPNSKILKVGIPGLEVGDTLHYLSLDKTVKPRVPNAWSDYRILEYHGPIKRYVYEVRGPKELPLQRIALKDEIKGRVKYTTGEIDGMYQHVWEVTNVPRMFDEPSMPEFYTVVQRLLLSTMPDWESISKWYWSISAEHLKASPEIEAKVKDLTAGIDDRQKKIEAIFHFVSQEIRYLGITVEKDAPGYEPHDVKLTFDNRHGVCRDKAALLVSMLRAAGMKAWPVLIHNGPKKDEEVPQLFFNHAISAVENEDGSYILMDSTDENTKDILPAYLCNRSYLVAKPEGEKLQTSPIIPAEENLMRVKTTAHVDAMGTLTGSSDLKFDGINDNIYRSYFARVTPEERRRFFEGVVKGMMAGARLKVLVLEPENLLDTTQIFKAHIEFEASDILVANDTTIMLPLPRLGNRLGMVNYLLNGGTGLDTRKYPLKTDLACGAVEALSVTLDPALGVPVAMPQYPKIEDETLKWEQTLKVSGSATTQTTLLEGTSEFLLKVVEFNPQQYLQLKETLETLEYNSRKMPILARKSAPRTTEKAEATTTPTLSAEPALFDVVIKSARTEFDLIDAYNWTETNTIQKQIATYKGKKDSSEIRINYNPAWEEVKLISAVVTTRGDVKEISPQEINLMDADWVGSAPRYPGARTLVASLPGVEVGSILDYKVVHTYRDHPFFSMTETFRYNDPVESKTVILRAPKDLELRVREGMLVPGEMEGVERQGPAVEGERRIWAWTSGEQHNVRRENNLPPWWSFNPSVMASAGNWATYAKTLNSVLTKATTAQPITATQVKKLTAGIEDKKASLIALRDFVAKSIRDAGPTLNALPLSAITSADQVLADGYGNTSDRAVLLHAMLQAAGFAPRFVLASGGSMIPVLQDPIREIPSAVMFPSVLVAVELENDTIYLNDTNQYAALGATPHDGRLGIVLNTGEMLTIHATAGRETRADLIYNLKVTEEGDASLRITRLLSGNTFASNHEMFAQMPPEERNRFFQQSIAAISQSAAADSEFITNFETYPGVIEFSVKAKNYAVRDGDFLYFKLPGTLRNLLSLSADTRDAPYYWETPQRMTVTVGVQLPESFGAPILTPDTLAWQSPANGGDIIITEEKKKGFYTITQKANLNPALLPAEEYPKLLDLSSRLNHVRAATVMAKKVKE